MSPLTAARIQMELSLGFHMIFAAIGMAMPLLMLIAEWRWIRHQDAEARRLAHVWAKLTAVTFAIGAVSGTALSFELGLLWPRFMAFAGPLIGPAFALEGYAFFIEAIFLGLYLYGWERLPARQHWWCGVAVAVSGAVSAVMVLAVNAWMQHPVGFTASPTARPSTSTPGRCSPTRPGRRWPPTRRCRATRRSASRPPRTTRGRCGASPAAARYARLGLTISMAVATVAAIAMPLTGDLLAKRAHHHQPAKLAAAEAHFETQRRAPLTIGGWPDVERRETSFAIEIPGALSFLADSSLETEVIGLDRVPRDQWPNVLSPTPPSRSWSLRASRCSGCRSGMAGVVALAWPRVAASRCLLVALVVCGPLGFLALEAGWVVTEVGRQPWVIYGVMRTADAATTVRGVWASLALFSTVYAGLLVLLVFFVRRLRRSEAA